MPNEDQRNDTESRVKEIIVQAKNIGEYYIILYNQENCHYSFISNSVTNIANFFYPIRNSRRQMMIEQKEQQNKNFEQFYSNWANEKPNTLKK